MSNTVDALTCKIWTRKAEGHVTAVVTGLDRFRVSLTATDSVETPDWLAFGRQVRLSLFVAGVERLEVPASVVRSGLQGDARVVVVQIRELSAGGTAALEELLGLGGGPAGAPDLPPLPALPAVPRPTGSQRPKAPPRPSPGSERRAHQRFELNADLWVTVGSKTYVMTVMDLSQGGMQCEVPLDQSIDWIQEGKNTKMKLFPAGEEPVELRGRIARVIPQRGNRPASFGVAFQSVAAKTLISRLLRTLASQLAAGLSS